MDSNNQDELVKNEIKELLKKMHNGESLLVTLNKIMDTVKGVKYIQEKKFIYMLQGLSINKISALTATQIDENFLEGFNEAAEENNFGVKLAVSAIMGEK